LFDTSRQCLHGWYDCIQQSEEETRLGRRCGHFGDVNIYQKVLDFVNPSGEGRDKEARAVSSKRNQLKLPSNEAILSLINAVALPERFLSINCAQSLILMRLRNCVSKHHLLYSLSSTTTKN
jgi:hypothetical protein